MQCKKCGKTMKIKSYSKTAKEVMYNWLCQCGNKQTTWEEQ